MVEDVLLERGVQLGPRGTGLLVLGNPAAHAHHVSESPVRDAIAIGEAAPAVPVDRVCDAVEVLVELPRKPGLPDPGDASHRDEVRLALVGAAVKEVLDLPQLAVAADERCLEAGGLERAAQAGDDALRLPERCEPLLALELERAHLLEDDRLLSRAPRRLADEYGTRVGDRLHACRGVHEVACDHALSLGAERDGRLAREDARARLELGSSDLVAQRGHGRDEVERRPHGALGVVLSRGRRAQDRHDRVPDELLDRAAVELDQSAARVEVAREELAYVLGVAALRDRREADEVGEEDGDEATLGGGSSRPRCGRRCRYRERRAALAAELHAGRIGRSA